VEITVPLLPELKTIYEDATITDPKDRATAFGQYDHFRVFGADFFDILQSIGFEVALYDGDNCDKKIAPLTAPSKCDYNKIFICKKSCSESAQGRVK